MSAAPPEIRVARDFRYHCIQLTVPMTTPVRPSAARILERCDALARCSEQSDALTRVFLSPEQRAANTLALNWMR